MNIYVIYGEDEVSARNYFLEIIKKEKEKGSEIIRVSPLAKEGFMGEVSSRSLFSNKVLYVLEYLSKADPKEINWLVKNSDRLGCNLLVYEKGELGKKYFSSLPKNTKSKKFDLPKLIFDYLSLIVPGNTTEVLKMLHKITENEPVEFIFALTSKHFRDLYWVKKEASSLPYPSWRVGKLKSQAAKFSEVTLKNIIQKLSEIDILVKTSRADLLSSLDLMFIRELE